MPTARTTEIICRARSADMTCPPLRRVGKPSQVTGVEGKDRYTNDTAKQVELAVAN
jgi:hypothetical protein